MRPTSLPKGPDPDSLATRQEFAAALTVVRESAGLTVREVARAAGISPSTVGGYFSGRHLPPLRPSGGVRAILGACGITDTAEVETWQRALLRVRRAPGPRPGAFPTPYRGLAPYRAEDEALLFGRDAELTQLLDRLSLPPEPARPADDTGLTVLLGRAGSGKSSLVSAGLLPRLRAAGRPAAVLVPGPTPLLDLAAALAELTGIDPDAAHGALLTQPATIRTLIPASGSDTGRRTIVLPDATTAPEDHGHRPVLVVDRFEALLTAGANPAEQDTFVRALAAVARREPRAAAPADVLVVLRTEAVPDVAHFPDLASALRTTDLRSTDLRSTDDGTSSCPPRVVNLASMSEGSLRAVVLGPARQTGLDVDHDLVDVVLMDVADLERRGEAALPRLSHALLTTWRRAGRDRLSQVAYREAGGVLGSVDTVAEAMYRSLPDDDRAALVELLPTLLTGEIRHAATTAVRVLADAGLLDLTNDRPTPVSPGLLQGWSRLASTTSTPDTTRPDTTRPGLPDRRSALTGRRRSWAAVATAVVVLGLFAVTGLALHLAR